MQHVVVEMTNGGLDDALEVVGIVEVMRSALEARHKGWGNGANGRALKLVC